MKKAVEPNRCIYYSVTLLYKQEARNNDIDNYCWSRAQATLETHEHTHIHMRAADCETQWNWEMIA